MFNWFVHKYVALLVNFNILVANPTSCSAVELLRLFSYTLLIVFVLKFLIHVFTFRYLKTKFAALTENSHPDIFKIYKSSAHKVGLKRVPKLFEFHNAKPLVFTIGSLQPTIFLAPMVSQKLAADELQATFIHELIHIKRRDNLLIWFAEIFFFAIPLLIIQVFAISFIFSIANSSYALLGALLMLVVFKAFLWKRMIFLRELSCDDLSVEKIKDPLILAASLVNVWRLSKDLPNYRWRHGLAFSQTLLPSFITLHARIKRLTNYRRPWFKFFFAKVLKVTGTLFIIVSSIFLWRFYTNGYNQNNSAAATSFIYSMGEVCKP